MTDEARQILGVLGWASIGDFTRRVPIEPIAPIAGELRDLAIAINVLLDDLQDLDQQRIEAEAHRAAAAAAVAGARARATLLAELGHELRTPLNAIVGIAQLLVEPGGAVVADQPALTRDLRSSADHLLDLVDDLLLHARLEAGAEVLQVQPFDLKELLAGCMDLVRHRPGNPEDVRLLLVDELTTRDVMGDSLRLRQVLLNLLSNALRATTAGSVTLRAREEGDRVRFAVADTGHGLTEAELTRAFEPFNQAGGRTIDGTGLGLTISRRIVEAMGGSLLAFSEPNQGSTFSFAIPLATAAPDAVRPSAPTVDEDQEQRSLRVLVAEDHPTTQIVTRRLLERAGHEVTMVGDGRAAVDAALTGSHDAVLLDMRMPVLNGLDAAREIRAGWPEDRGPLVLIGLTADATPEDRERGLQAGLDDYIAKPFRIADLTGRLQDLLG